MLKINGLKLTVYYWFLSQLSISRWASTSIRNSYLQLLWVNLTFRNLSLHITNITEDELPWKESYLKRYSEKLLTVGTLKRKENWYKNWKRKIFKIYLYVERKKCITAVALYIAYYIKKINLEIKMMRLVWLVHSIFWYKSCWFWEKIRLSLDRLVAHTQKFKFL